MLKDCPSCLSALQSPDTARLIVSNTSFAESQKSPVSLHTWLHCVYSALSPAPTKRNLLSGRPGFYTRPECTSSYLFCAFVCFPLLCGMKIFILATGLRSHSAPQVQPKPTSSAGISVTPTFRIDFYLLLSESIGSSRRSSGPWQ